MNRFLRKNTMGIIILVLLIAWGAFNQYQISSIKKSVEHVNYVVMDINTNIQVPRPLLSSNWQKQSLGETLSSIVSQLSYISGHIVR